MEAPQECPRPEARISSHRREIGAARALSLQPMLDLQHGFVAVVKLGREAAVEPLLAPGGVDQKIARRRQHRRRPEETVDQPEAEVGPGHHPAGRNDVAVVDDQPVGVDMHIGKPRGEIFGVAPMRGRPAAAQQSRFSDEIGPAAGRAKRGALGMPLAQPQGERPKRLGPRRPLEGRRRKEDSGQGGTPAVGVETAFHRFAVARDAPMGDAQAMRRVAAEFARDPARLEEKIGEPVDRGELRIGIGYNANLRRGAAGRHCQVRLEECHFRQSALSARRRKFSTSEAINLQSAEGSTTCL